MENKCKNTPSSSLQHRNLNLPPIFQTLPPSRGLPGHGRCENPAKIIKTQKSSSSLSWVVVSIRQFISTTKWFYARGRFRKGLYALHFSGVHGVHGLNGLNRFNPVESTGFTPLEIHGLRSTPSIKYIP